MHKLVAVDGNDHLRLRLGRYGDFVPHDQERLAHLGDAVFAAAYAETNVDTRRVAFRSEGNHDQFRS